MILHVIDVCFFTFFGNFAGKMTVKIKQLINLASKTINIGFNCVWDLSKFCLFVVIDEQQQRH